METTRYPLQGNGKVLKGTEEIASVRYTLYVTQELVGTGRAKQVAGPVKRVNGELQVTKGAALTLSEGVELVLEDGRRLDFRPTLLIDPARRAYSFVIMSNMQSLAHKIY